MPQKECFLISNLIDRTNVARYVITDLLRSMLADVFTDLARNGFSGYYLPLFSVLDLEFGGRYFGFGVAGIIFWI